MGPTSSHNFAMVRKTTWFGYWNWLDWWWNWYVILCPLTEYLIQEFGWRLAYQWLGIISGILIVSAALFLTKDPTTNFYHWFNSKYKLLGKQYPIENTAVVFGGVEQCLNMSNNNNLSKIIKDPIFWKMINTFGLWWLSGAITTVTLAPFYLKKD